MRIAVLAPVWFAVPPLAYGGIEWVVWLLADGLVAAGHDVTLFATGRSRTTARLEYVYFDPPTSDIGRVVPELRHVLRCYDRQDEFDVISDHTGMLAAAIGGVLRTPVAHTVHGVLDGESGTAYAQISRLAPRVGLVSISLNQRRPRPDLNWIANCPNALDLGLYPFVEHARREYLFFLGRMSPEKGAHRAVALALETGLPLRLAGKMHEASEQAYFDSFIRPHLSDRIEYLGEVPHSQKVALLQQARATLFPVDWEEPFGLVMIESMACGTPVIATRHGAVPEVIEDGRSGIIVDDWSRAAAALADADRIPRTECRRSAEERFAPERMVRDYQRAFEQLVGSS